MANKGIPNPYDLASKAPLELSPEQEIQLADPIEVNPPDIAGMGRELANQIEQDAKLKYLAAQAEAKQKAKADKIAVNDFEAKARRIFLENKSEVLRTQGLATPKQADAARDKSKKQIDELVSSYKGTSPEVFTQARMKAENSFEEDVQMYEVGQFKKVSDDAFKENISSLQDEAGMKAYSADSFRNSITDLSDKVFSYGVTRYGTDLNAKIGPNGGTVREIIGQEMQNAQSGAILNGIIATATTNDLDRAEEIFKEYEGRLDVGARKKASDIIAKVREAKEEASVYGFVALARQESADREGQLAWINANTPNKQVSKARAMIKSEWAIADAEKTRKESEATNKAYDLLNKKVPYGSPEVQQLVSQMPADKVTEIVDRLDKNNGKWTPNNPNFATFDNLLGKINNSAPNELGPDILTSAHSELSPAQFKIIEREYNSKVRAVSDEAEYQKREVPKLTHDAINSVLDSMNIIDKAQRGKIVNDVYEDVKAIADKGLRRSDLLAEIRKTVQTKMYDVKVENKVSGFKNFLNYFIPKSLEFQPEAAATTEEGALLEDLPKVPKRSRRDLNVPYETTDEYFKDVREYTIEAYTKATGNAPTEDQIKLGMETIIKNRKQVPRRKK